MGSKLEIARVRAVILASVTTDVLRTLIRVKPLHVGWNKPHALTRERG